MDLEDIVPVEDLADVVNISDLIECNEAASGCNLCVENVVLMVWGVGAPKISVCVGYVVVG